MSAFVSCYEGSRRRSLTGSALDGEVDDEADEVGDQGGDDAPAGVYESLGDCLGKDASKTHWSKQE
jgi:hypothetical protein